LRRQYDAFWFPASVRDAIMTSDRHFEYLHFSKGSQVPDRGDETVTVRWPRLDLHDWEQVLNILAGSRRHTQVERWRQQLPWAMNRMQALWADRANPLREDVLHALETCTGHSAGMLDVALNLLDLVSVEDLQRAASCRFTHAIKNEFVPLDVLAGRVRFFADGMWSNQVSSSLLRFGSYRDRDWRLHRRPADCLLGYAAGNVPGTGLLLVLLGLSMAADGGIPPPLILIKNSRHEPLFTPLVLTALELVDPTLLSTTLVTIWDHADRTLQEYLISKADLVIAAASDETVAELGQTVRQVSSRSRPVRYHPHGHKVSFCTVSRECLEAGRTMPDSDVPWVHAVALLTSLDTALWNQQGCLSSRVHFVEQGDEQAFHQPEVYGQAVVRELRALDKAMPRGISQGRQIHNLFDKYQAMASAGGLQVLSDYDDDFLVFVDRRLLSGEQFREIVNDCQGRTVAIIPVGDIMDVPERYLKEMHPQHLQTMSVAAGDPDQPGLDPRFLGFAEAIGVLGVTSIRTVGRGAFPQLAYSWDGLIPLDLAVKRQKGHFTTVEFDEPWVQIRRTYRLVKQILMDWT
jgi:hypothetical protein